MATTPTVPSSTPTGSRLTLVASLGGLGSRSTAITSATAAIGTTARKTSRHEMLVSSPPTSAPTASPPAPVVPQTASARFRSSPAGNAADSNARVEGASMAAPMPWAARIATRIPGRSAKPAISEPAANTARPQRNSRRAPNTSATRPQSSSRPAKARAYAVTTHWSPAWSNRRSVPIEGKAT